MHDESFNLKPFNVEIQENRLFHAFTSKLYTSLGVSNNFEAMSLFFTSIAEAKNITAEKRRRI